jgi:hypothetical protein
MRPLRAAGDDHVHEDTVGVMSVADRGERLHAEEERVLEPRELVAVPAIRACGPQAKRSAKKRFGAEMARGDQQEEPWPRR